MGLSKDLIRFSTICAYLRRVGHSQKYDCVVGASGVPDAPNFVYLADKWELNLFLPWQDMEFFQCA